MWRWNAHRPVRKDGADGAQRKDRKEQGVNDMALSRLVQSRGGATEGFTYSCAHAEAHGHAQQYNRLRAFIQEASTEYKDDLEVVLFPMFAHLYLDMLTHGHKTAAHKFYSRHSSGFFQCEKKRSLVDNLGQLYSLTDLQENKTVLQFIDNQFSVSLSEDTLQYLLRFLKHDDCTLLLQMFNNHMHVKIRGTCVSQDLFQHEDRHLEGLEPVSQPCTPENRVITDPVTLNSLQESICKVRKSTPTIPSVCFFTFLNTYQGLCNVDFSNNDSMLAGAFEDSSIRLWQLTRQPKHSDQSHDSGGSQSKHTKNIDDGNVNISQVHLSGDHIEDVQTKNSQASIAADGSELLRGHSGSVYSVSFTPDNQHLLSASEDTTVRMWDLHSSKNVVCYRGHSYPVWSVHASPIGGCFASASKDRCARIWSYDRVFPLQTLAGHTSDVDIVRFHPNGSYVATGSCDHTLRLWSVHEGRCMRLLHGHKAPIFALAFSPDGKLLASAGEDKRVRLWDLGAGSLVKELKGHSDTVHSLCFHANSSVLISGGADCMLRFWDVRNDVTHAKQPEQNNSAELLGAFPTKSAGIHTISFSAKNYVMAAGSIT